MPGSDTHRAVTLDDYFEVHGPDDVRLRGHRVGIDDVLGYYLEGYTPEEIAAHLPSLTLEQIHATITYYLRNRRDVEALLMRIAASRETAIREWADSPSPLVERLRALRAERDAPPEGRVATG